MTAKPEKVDLQQVLESMTPSGDSRVDSAQTPEQASVGRWRLIDSEGLATECDLPAWDDQSEISDDQHQALPSTDNASDLSGNLPDPLAEELDAWEIDSVDEFEDSQNNQGDLPEIHPLAAHRCGEDCQAPENEDRASCPRCPAGSPCRESQSGAQQPAAQPADSQCLRKIADSGISLLGLQSGASNSARSSSPARKPATRTPERTGQSRGIAMPTANPRLAEQAEPAANRPAHPLRAGHPTPAAPIATIEAAKPLPPALEPTTPSVTPVTSKANWSGDAFDVPLRPSNDSAQPSQKRKAVAASSVARETTAMPKLFAADHPQTRTPLRPSSRGIDPDLIRIMDIWPTLSPTVQHAILAMLEATRRH